MVSLEFVRFWQQVLAYHLTLAAITCSDIVGEKSSKNYLAEDPASPRRWPSVGLMLVQRLWRWTNINPTLGERFVFAEERCLWMWWWVGVAWLTFQVESWCGPIPDNSQNVIMCDGWAPPSPTSSLFVWDVAKFVVATKWCSFTRYSLTIYQHFRQSLEEISYRLWKYNT